MFVAYNGPMGWVENNITAMFVAENCTGPYWVTKVSIVCC